MPDTARDIITLALFDAGVFGTGQTPNAWDINTGLTRLNDMIATWKRHRWMIWANRDTSLAMTGAVSYTIGTGQQFDVPRPDRLEAAFIRQTTPAVPNQPDWPLELVSSMEAYSLIRLKQMASFPNYVFDDSAYPVGRIFPWPLPSSLYELHLIIKTELQSFENLSEEFAMPDEYKRALRLNLQIELLNAYKLPVPDSLVKTAAAALSTIRNANTQIPIMTLPPELVRSGNYNVFSDNTT